jgi:hypothetical protein
LAAVDVDGRAVQPSSSRRHDEGDEARDILRLPKTGDVELLAMMFDRGGFL